MGASSANDPVIGGFECGVECGSDRQTVNTVNVGSESDRARGSALGREDKVLAGNDVGLVDRGTIKIGFG